MATQAPPHEHAHAVSHGRGGQGNIGPDPTEYVDGEIHREGDPATGSGNYSTGRGGAANIGSPKLGAAKTTDDDIVPEVAIVKADDTYHAGRGGEGNAVVAGGEKVEKKRPHDGLAERLKKRLSVLVGKLAGGSSGKSKSTPAA
ncbi:hypothetical protein FN846DRAFT_93647 [Sphaerosporella brunnea]|uniref:DUF3602 domain-containing protein n=1 Tax=Sphaerosporella brunnea TaxID=1250544 RepID=A0A5J5ET18_9PEZI|nr:hypothetical protein FN846DRAFT_93647 [Sphaerosporella brunnea]